MNSDDTGLRSNIHDAVSQAVRETKPDEVYYLAAHHHSSEGNRNAGGQLVRDSFAVNLEGWLGALETARQLDYPVRLFYAASSHIFGEPIASPQDEQTSIEPLTPYGISKAAGVHLARYYRKNFGTFASCGILYSHESPRRGAGFLSRRVVEGAIAVKEGRLETLRIGNLAAAIDWGYAPDYVDAMWRILQLDQPDDFIVASGELSTVRDFVECVFSWLGLDWHKYVVEDPSIIHGAMPEVPLCGDASKLQRTTGWRPTHDLQSLSRLLVTAELAATH